MRSTAIKTLVMCATLGVASVVTVPAQGADIDARWPEWTRAAERIVEQQRPDSARARELDLDGTERRSINLALDPDGNPLRGGGPSSPEFTDIEIYEVPLLVFEQDWPTRSAVAGTRQVRGVTARGVTLAAPGRRAELWYAERGAALLQTSFWPSGDDYPRVQTEFRADGVLSFSIQSLNERAIRSNSIREIEFTYGTR